MQSHGNPQERRFSVDEFHFLDFFTSRLSAISGRARRPDVTTEATGIANLRQDCVWGGCGQTRNRAVSTSTRRAKAASPAQIALTHAMVKYSQDPSKTGTLGGPL